MGGGHGHRFHSSDNGTVYDHGNNRHHGNSLSGYGLKDENNDGYCDGTGIPFLDRNGDGAHDAFFGENKLTHNNIPFINILDGTPFVYSGEVMSIGFAGSGIVVETDNGDVTINGLGPLWFWACNDTARPVAGDLVEVTCYIVDYNDIELNIAVSVTIDGQTLDLRDLDSGTPFWRGGRRACQ